MGDRILRDDNFMIVYNLIFCQRNPSLWNMPLIKVNVSQNSGKYVIPIGSLHSLMKKKEKGVDEMTCPRRKKMNVLQAQEPYRASLLDPEIRENPVEAIYRKWVIDSSR